MNDGPCNSPMTPMREKLWSERTDAEKLEALRSVVIAMHTELRRTTALVGTLMSHEHSGRSVMVPIESHELGVHYVPLVLRDKE